MARLVADYHAGRMTVTDVTAAVRVWVNHARYGNTVGLRKAVLSRVALRPSAERPAVTSRVRA